MAVANWTFSISITEAERKTEGRQYTQHVSEVKAQMVERDQLQWEEIKKGPIQNRRWHNVCLPLLLFIITKSSFLTASFTPTGSQEEEESCVISTDSLRPVVSQRRQTVEPLSGSKHWERMETMEKQHFNWFFLRGRAQNRKQSDSFLDEHKLSELSTSKTICFNTR